ncbi:methyltransferase domain-containing protein [Gordonia sp. LSe1-13]|uniref:Methyltransferase domain-containing protein n=1 Tax=Gordonia sesuvii TaxID=3116777 RepID=A0ABU7MHV8_9ACTN|nr:methyltransferase domain-containing protein [Gordonia sp. LSe1-13]
MSKARTGQIGDAAAEIYEEFFVPALFDQWPPRLLDRTGVRRGERVLEVGCGTGALTREALAWVGPDGSVAAIDPNDGMRAVAARMCPGALLHAGVAEDLPFADDSFDRVVCQFVLMFCTDRRRAVAQMARVLRPGGSLGILTWAQVAENPGYDAMATLVRRLFGDVQADALLAPFVIGTPELLRDELADAFAEVEIVRLDGEACFPSVEAWVRTDVKGWTLGDLIDDDQYEHLLRAAARDLAVFAGTDGVVRFPAPALAAVARHPA